MLKFENALFLAQLKCAKAIAFFKGITSASVLHESKDKRKMMHSIRMFIYTQEHYIIFWANICSLYNTIQVFVCSSHQRIDFRGQS